jgi:hypothetical protein
MQAAGADVSERAAKVGTYPERQHRDIRRDEHGGSVC